MKERLEGLIGLRFLRGHNGPRAGRWDIGTVINALERREGYPYGGSSHGVIRKKVAEVAA
jgi:hypothetical protein